MGPVNIEDWSAEELAELAVPEFDPSYLPSGMAPPSTWFTEDGLYTGTTIILNDSLAD